MPNRLAPLTVAQVRNWLPEYKDDYAGTDSGTARLEADLDNLLKAMPFGCPARPSGSTRNGPALLP